MDAEGPPLEALTRRLAECPPEFLAPPSVDGGTVGSINVAAIVCDHVRAIQETGHHFEELIRNVNDPPVQNRMSVIAVATWLLHDDWFLARPDLLLAMKRLLVRGLDSLASVVLAESLVTDPDRREELARLCLRQLGLRPQGETISQAADRLTSLDSIERDRVVRETQAAEERARQVREMMARRAAEEAAAKASRE